MFSKSVNLGILFKLRDSVYILTASEMKVESMLPAKDVTGDLTGIFALAVAKANLAHRKMRIWQILRPNSPWSKCRHVKVSSSGGSGVKWLLTLGWAACLTSAPGGAQPPGGGGWPPCADTFPPCHPFIATPVALAAVGAGVNPPLGGDTQPVVEDVSSVVGAGVNPPLGGDTQPVVEDVSSVVGAGVNPLRWGDTKPCEEVLAGALPPVAVPHGGGGGLGLAAVVLEGGQQASSPQRLLISCHWIVGNISCCRSITSWAVTPLWRSSA